MGLSASLTGTRESDPRESGPARARTVVGRIRRGAPEPAESIHSLLEIGLASGAAVPPGRRSHLAAYEQHLGHLRHRRFKLLDLGGHKGSSLPMWEQFFTRARIIGVDPRRRSKRLETERITVRTGDPDDPDLLRRLATNHRFLVVVADASARPSRRADPFATVWPAVRPGGVFILEGTARPPVSVPGSDHGAGGDDTAYPSTSAEDDFAAYARTTIASVEVLDGAVIVRKKAHAQPWFRTGSMADQPGRVWTRSVGTTYDRIDARVLDASPRVEARLAGLVASGPVAFEDAASGEVVDATVYGSGPTVTSDGTILTETLNCTQNLRRDSDLYRPFGPDRWVVERSARAVRFPARDDGKHYVLLKQTWDRNYGHWLIDALPKLALLEGEIPLEDCVFVVNQQPDTAMRAVVLDSLEAAGVQPWQVRFTPLGKLRFDRLVVLGTTTRHPLVKSPLSVGFLERLGGQVERGGSPRIYVSRNQYSRRRLVNEDAVLEVLRRYGYDVVHPESLSFRDQVATFRGATHVVGNMGAALANLAFSPAGVSVLALATETMEHDFFYDIVCHKRGRYRGLQGRSVDASGIGADFAVDLARLDEALAWLHPGE